MSAETESLDRWLEEMLPGSQAQWEQVVSHWTHNCGTYCVPTHYGAFCKILDKWTLQNQNISLGDLTLPNQTKTIYKVYRHLWDMIDMVEQAPSLKDIPRGHSA